MHPEVRRHFNEEKNIQEIHEEIFNNICHPHLQNIPGYITKHKSK